MENNEKKHTFVNDLTNILVTLGAINTIDAQALKENFMRTEGASYEEFLLDEGLVEKEELLQALSKHYKVPSFDVMGIFFDHLLLTNFPKDFLLRNAIIPLELDNDELVIVAASPDVVGLAQAIARFTENDIVFMVGIGREICDAVKEFYDKALTEEVSEDEDLQEEHRLEREAEEYIQRKSSILIEGDDE